MKRLRKPGRGSGGVTIPGVFKNMWIWLLRTWFNGDYDDCAGLAVGRDDPKGLFHPE